MTDIEDRIRKIEKDFTDVKATQEAQNEMFEQMNKNVTTILQAIKGDESMMHDGLIKVVKRHEKYIEDDKIRKAKAYGAMTAGGILYGLILKFFDKIFL